MIFANTKRQLTARYSARLARKRFDAYWSSSGMPREPPVPRQITYKPMLVGRRRQVLVTHNPQNRGTDFGQPFCCNSRKTNLANWTDSETTNRSLGEG